MLNGPEHQVTWYGGLVLLLGTASTFSFLGSRLNNKKRQRFLTTLGGNFLNCFMNDTQNPALILGPILTNCAFNQSD